MKKSYIISVDMGGTKILGAVVGMDGTIVYRFKSETVKDGKIADPAIGIFAVITNLLVGASLKAEDIAAVSVGVPGSVNFETGVIGMAPNLGLKNYPLKEKLEALTPIPVYIENDVNLAALGVCSFGRGVGMQNVLTVFVGTGIGGGIVINGKLYRGNKFVAGEIGHITVDPSGPLCGCGMFGCFEAVASRTAVVKRIIADIKAGKRSRLKSVVEKKGQIKSKALALALKEKDPLVVKHLGNACKQIGVTLAGLNNFFNFDMIVLGGGVMEAMGRTLLPLVKKHYKEYSLKEAGKHCQLVLSVLGDDAALYGGIALAKEMIGEEV